MNNYSVMGSHGKHFMSNDQEGIRHFENANTSIEKQKGNYRGGVMNEKGMGMNVGNHLRSTAGGFNNTSITHH